MLPKLTDLTAAMGDDGNSDVTVAVNLPTIPIDNSEFLSLCKALEVQRLFLDPANFATSPQQKRHGLTKPLSVCGPGRWGVFNGQY